MPIDIELIRFGIFRGISGTIHNTRNIGRNNRQQLDEEMLTTFVQQKAGILSAYESYADQRPQYLKKLKSIESY